MASHILSGPISLSDVTTFVMSSLEAFYRTSNRTCPETQVRTLPTIAVLPEPKVEGWYLLPERGYEEMRRARRAYQRAQQIVAPILQARASDLGAIVIAQGHDKFWDGGWFFGCNSGVPWADELLARIVDKTLLEELAEGQTFHSAKKEFLIATYFLGERSVRLGEYNNWRIMEKIEWLNNFDAYLRPRVARAQANIDSHVSKAASNIVQDLHS